MSKIVTLCSKTPLVPFDLRNLLNYICHVFSKQKGKTQRVKQMTITESKPRFSGPWGGPPVKEEYIPPNRDAAAPDDGDDGPVEWKGMPDDVS